MSKKDRQQTEDQTREAGELEDRNLDQVQGGSLNYEKIEWERSGIHSPRDPATGPSTGK